MQYVTEGYAVVPIPGREKGPRIPGWQHLRLGLADLPRYFSNGANIGWLLGGASPRKATDVDLDAAEARALAGAFLPPTQRVSGRPSSPASHWFYEADPLVGPKQFHDPVRVRDQQPDTMLVELRSTGQQTVVPPSVHPSGEPIEWSNAGPPEIVHGQYLQQCVSRLAAAALLARYWPGKGSRHYTAMAVAGMLARNGWEEQDTTDFLTAVTRVARDPEDRGKDVATTYHKIAADEETTGIPKLATLVDPIVVDAVTGWLGLRRPLDPVAALGFDPAASPPNGASTSAAPSLPSPGKSPMRTDQGNGERFIAQHRQSVCCVHYSASQQTWHTWDGTRWASDRGGVVDQLAQRTVRTIYLEAAKEPNDDERKALARWAHESESQGRRSAMLASARPWLMTQQEKLNIDPWLLNCPNGTINLRAGTLQPHRREDYITKLAGAPFDPAADCPTWLAFLDQIMAGRQDVIDFLQRALGYSLTGDVSEHVLLFLYGTGRNGKSTFLQAVRDVLGDYGLQAAPDMLLSKPSAQHPTERADLYQMRFVTTIEAGAGRKLDEPLVKLLTGGDPIRARRMREDFWEFLPTHKLWLAANHKPEVRGTDQGIWSRICLIPFEVTIGAATMDKHLGEKLHAEAAGILRWMAEGCQIWQRDGLKPPVFVQQATTRYRVEMDVLADFLAECCELGDTFYCPSGELYKEYERWCVENSERGASQRAFAFALEERGFSRQRLGRGGSRCYAGLRVRGTTYQESRLAGSLTQAMTLTQDTPFSDMSLMRDSLKQVIPENDPFCVSGTDASPVLGAPCVGDAVWLLGTDGAIQNTEPWRIASIELSSDRSAYAMFEESPTGWPLLQCERAE